MSPTSAHSQSQSVPSGSRVDFISLETYAPDLILAHSVMDPNSGVLWVAGRFGSLIAIDSQSLEVVKHLQLEDDSGASDLAIGAIDGSLWISTLSTLQRIDLKNEQTALSFGIGSGGPSIALSPDNRYVWVSKSFEGIERLDTANGHTQRLIPPQGETALIEEIMLSPDGGTLYALVWDIGPEIGSEARWLSAFDTSTFTETARLPINAGEGNAGLAEMAITPDGQTIFVAAPTSYSSGSPVISVDASTLSALGVVVGESQGGISVSPDGSQLWFSSGGNRMRSLDLTSGRTNGEIRGGGYCPVFSPGVEKWFTCNLGSGGVDVISASRSPGPPVRPRAIPTPVGFTVSWLPPNTTGGLPVKSFRAVASPGGASCRTRELTCQIRDLRPGITYSISVTAANDYGTGAPANVPQIKQFMTLVRPPQQVRASLAAGGVKVTWKSPPGAGRRTISGYTVTASPTGRTCETTGAKTCVFANLPAGLGYEFTVQAKTANGPGRPAASRRLMLPAPPSKPLPPAKPVRVLS